MPYYDEAEDPDSNEIDDGDRTGSRDKNNRDRTSGNRPRGTNPTSTTTTTTNRGEDASDLDSLDLIDGRPAWYDPIFTGIFIELRIK